MDWVIIFSPFHRCAPGARVLPTPLALITAEGPTEFLFNDVGIERIVKVPMERPSPDAARCFSPSTVAQQLGPVECLISLVQWHSAALGELLSLVRPAWSIGFHPEFDFCLSSNGGEHAADRTFKLVKKFAPNVELSDFADPPELPPQSVSAAEAVRRDRSEPIGGYWLCMKKPPPRRSVGCRPECNRLSSLSRPSIQTFSLSWCPEAFPVSNMIFLATRPSLSRVSPFHSFWP